MARILTSRIFRVLAVAICLFISLEPGRADLTREAEAAVNAGIAASNKGNFAQALVDFLEAHKEANDHGVFPTPELYRYLGQTEAKIPGREFRAICWLAAYLSVDPQVADGDDIKKQIQALDDTCQKNVRAVAQMTEDAGKQAATEERARGNVEDALDTVVVLWDDVGDISKARDIAASIQDDYIRCGSYGRIESTQIDSGDFKGAWETITVEKENGWFGGDSTWPARTRLDIIGTETRLAEAEVKAGDRKSARKAVTEATALVTFSDTYLRSQAYRSIAQAQAAMGDIDGAKQSVALIVGEDARVDDRFDAQLAIATAQVKAGDHAGAAETFAAAIDSAEHIPQADLKQEKLRAFVDAQKDTSNIMDARQALNTLLVTLGPENSTNLNLYFAVAMVEIKLGDHDGARRIADYFDADAKSMILTAIAAVGKPPVAPNPPYEMTRRWLEMLDTTVFGRRRGPILDSPVFSDYPRLHFGSPRERRKRRAKTRRSYEIRQKHD